MIGRRLAQSLAQQNWTAISIEFVLLVAGVFLAIQAANWNQEREVRSKAAIFTVRLHEDLRYELWGEQVLIEYYSAARKHAELALQALSGKHPLSDEQWLISAYRATQYRTLSRRRATHDELVSTGAIGLITDARLREVAVSFFLSDLYETTARKAQESEYRRLFRESLPFDVQNSLLQKCGDRDADALDYAALAHQLDYECALGLPPETIAEAAAALRAQVRLVPALQLRQADLNTAVNDLTQHREGNQLGNP